MSSRLARFAVPLEAEAAAIVADTLRNGGRAGWLPEGLLD